METCELCDSKDRLQYHHLIYIPEKTMVLCYTCHTILHMLTKIPKEKCVIIVQTMLSLIETYSSHWNSGAANYSKSQCKKERNRIYYQKNKERMDNYRKQWRETNKGYSKIYYWKNKERINNYQKQWYQNNKEKIREYNKRDYKKRVLKALSNT